MQFNVSVISSTPTIPHKKKETKSNSVNNHLSKKKIRTVYSVYSITNTESMKVFVIEFPQKTIQGFTFIKVLHLNYH